MTTPCFQLVFLLCLTVTPTGLCCVLHLGPPDSGALGLTPVMWEEAGRHWVDGSSPGQESHGSFAAGSA